MNKKLNEFKATSKFLVAIDSDGCVFDTMTIKHQKFFYPILEKELGLEVYREQLSKIWDHINLYSELRGVNRFLGVYYLFKEIDEQKIFEMTGLKVYNEYLENNKRFTLDDLKGLYNDTKDEFVGHIINWSEKVNEDIGAHMPVVDAFEESRITMASISGFADIAVVSSANESALQKEWTEAGLMQYVSVLTSQNEGSKQHILSELLAKGYEKDNVLMIGDAPGDREAAAANDVKFRLIEAMNENRSWKNIRNEFDNGGIFDDGK